MKNINATLQAAIADGTIATAVKLTSDLDGDVVGFTNFDYEVNLDGTTYKPAPGLQRIVMALRNNAEVSNQEFTSAWVVDLPDTELYEGKWDNALIEVSKFNWEIPTVPPAPDAVEFNSNTWLQENAPSGITGGKQMTFSCWFFMDSLPGTYQYLLSFGDGATADRVRVWVQSDGSIQYECEDSLGFSAVHHTSDTGMVSSGQWNHVIISCDVENSLSHIYINNVAATTSPVAISDRTIDFTTNYIFLGRGNPIWNAFLGHMTEVWFDPSYIDITNATNRSGFIFNECSPANLGSDGSGPTGSQPYIYQTGEASDWTGVNNKGSMGPWDSYTGSWTNSDEEPAQLCSPTSQGTIPVFKGRLGQIQWSEDGFRADIHSLMRELQQPVGVQVTTNCRHQLFSQSGDELIGYCGVNKVSHTYAGSVTSIDVQKLKFDISTSQPDGWFSNGTIRFTTGNNSNIEREVKTQTGTNIELFRTFPYTIQIGDQYEIYTGCDKTYATCKSKFSNGAQYGGFPHIRNEVNFK